MYLAKEKGRYSECYKKFLYAGPKHFDKLKPETGPTEKTDPTYNSDCGNTLGPA